MLGLLGWRFNMARQEGGGAGNSQLMGRSHNFQPGGSVDFFWAQDTPHRVIQYFRSGTGHGIHPCCLELANDRGVTQVIFPSNELDFLGGKGMEMELGKILFDGLNQVLVVGQTLALNFGLQVQAPLHTNFRGPSGHCILDLGQDLGRIQPIGPISVGIAAKGTEAAMLLTNIGEVNITVDHIGDRFPHLVLAQAIGHLANGCHGLGVPLLEQNFRLFFRQVCTG
jgi:hypothetical protein